MIHIFQLLVIILDDENFALTELKTRSKNCSFSQDLCRNNQG